MKIAIVPARGGSKRIPHKNIIDFFGRPMLSYPLAAIRASGLFDVVHVSTDSPEIAKVAADCGFPVDFMRVASLANDTAGTMEVLRWVVEEYAKRGKSFDTIACVYPCTPLIEGSDLVAAHAVFVAHGGRKAVQTVSSYPAPIEWAYRRLPDGSLQPVTPGAFAKRSQDLPEAYYDAGAFYFFSPAQVNDRAASDAYFVSHVLPRSKVVDIDTEEDLTLAKNLFSARRPH